MFKIRLETEKLHPGYDEFLTDTYFHIYEVCPARNNHRESALLASDVVPGMTNPIQLDSKDPRRTTLYICPQALLTPDGAGSSSFVVHSEYSETVKKTTDAFLKSHENGPYYPPNVLGGCMWKIALYVRCRARATGAFLTEEGVAPEAARAKLAPLQSLVEFQVGECCLTVPLLLDLVSKGDRNSRIVLDLCGNRSGLLESLRTTSGSAPSIHVIYDEEIIPIGKAPQTYIYRHVLPECQRFGERVGRAVDAVKLLEQGYRSVFQDFRATLRMSFEQLRESAKNSKKIHPLASTMTLFHLPLLVTYGLVPEHALELPIWYYCLPRSDPKLAVDEKGAFLRLCLRATADIYGIAPEEIQSVLSDYLPGTSKGRSKVLTTAEVANMAAMRDVISHYMTLPAFMGKYRSDMKFSARNDMYNGHPALVGTESCDFSRISGAAVSDDCEGGETVTQQQYVLTVQTGQNTSSVPAEDANVARALADVSLFVATHYEYISAAGSTTSAFPGVDVHAELSGINQDDALVNQNGTALRTIRRMLYGSNEDKSAEIGFHQYSMLIPVLQMRDMLRQTAALEPEFAGTPEFKRLSTYYEARAQTSEAALPSFGGAVFVPPAVMLESTYPVSSQLVGASVYTLQEGKIDESVLECDRAAYSIAGSLRVFGRNATGDSEDFQARCKDLHALKIVAGHKDSATGKYRTFAEDRERYATGFYRHLCHGVNVTALMSNLDPMLSYLTFMDGAEKRFGVTLEHIAMGSLAPSNPARPKKSHYLLAPFAFIDAGVREEAATALARSQVAALLPPICFGTSSVTPTSEFYAVTKSTPARAPFYKSVLNTRILMIEGAAEEKERDVIAKFNQLIKQQEGRMDSPVQQQLKLFDVFGDKCMFYSVRV